MSSNEQNNPLKRKSTCVQGRRAPPPPPMVGRRPMLKMELHGERSPRSVTVLLDSGASTAAVSTRIAKKMSLPVHKRSQALPVQDFAGRVVEDAGVYYT